MTDIELRAIRDAGVAFARDNAQEMAVEILEWRKTSLLKDGKVRELARVLLPLDTNGSLTLAQSMAERAALEIVAEPAVNPAVPAIQFALDAEEGMTWLRLWNQGDFDSCRREWPEAPIECYIGADPLMQKEAQS